MRGGLKNEETGSRDPVWPCMTNCNGTGSSGVGFYASTNNNAFSSKVACANSSGKPGSKCDASSCSETVPASTSGFCVCKDSSLRYLHSGHAVSTCDTECSGKGYQFPSSWDSYYTNCSQKGDGGKDDASPSCSQQSDKGNGLMRIIMVVFAALVGIVLLLSLSSPRTKGKLKELQRLRRDLGAQVAAAKSAAPAAAVKK